LPSAHPIKQYSVRRITLNFGRRHRISCCRRASIGNAHYSENDQPDSWAFARLARIDPRLLSPIQHRNAQAKHRSLRTFFAMLALIGEWRSLLIRRIKTLLTRVVRRRRRSLGNRVRPPFLLPPRNITAHLITLHPLYCSSGVIPLVGHHLFDALDVPHRFLIEPPLDLPAPPTPPPLRRLRTGCSDGGSLKARRISRFNSDRPVTPG
jgi:hypothetical protein